MGRRIIISAVGSYRTTLHMGKTLKCIFNKKLILVYSLEMIKVIEVCYFQDIVHWPFFILIAPSLFMCFDACYQLPGSRVNNSLCSAIFTSSSSTLVSLLLGKGKAGELPLQSSEVIIYRGHKQGTDLHMLCAYNEK